MLDMNQQKMRWDDLRREADQERLANLARHSASRRANRQARGQRLRLFRRRRS